MSEGTERRGEPPVIEVTVAAPVEAVWRTLRDPELIRTWHGWHFEGLDAEVALIYVDHATVDEDAHVLKAGADDVFTCEEVPGGTRVRVTRPPFRPEDPWSAYYDEVTEGWTTFLQQLRFLHEHHPGRTRRTVALMGEGPAGSVPELWSSTPAALGERWFRSSEQQGMIIPSLGPGLLIIAARPKPDDQVAAMAVLTTYGLDDAEFETERESWSTWWRTAFPAAEPAQV
jgi:hypothetical protein